jgi:hypothetical protein
MFPRQITHQNIFRVLIAGFSLVILPAGNRDRRHPQHSVHPAERGQHPPRSNP